MVRLSASDRARAERLRAAILEPGATTHELVAILQEIREEATVLAVLMMERRVRDLIRHQAKYWRMRATGTCCGCGIASNQKYCTQCGQRNANRMKFLRKTRATPPNSNGEDDAR